MDGPLHQLEQYRSQIQSQLQLWMPQGDRKTPVMDAMRYAVLNPGKRLRPILMLEMAKLWRKNSELILPSACAVEFIHTASLILDDLPCMDGAEIRRGQPTVHRVFGEATAILAAFGLILHGLQTIHQNAISLGIAKSKIGRLFSSILQKLGIQGMIMGQSLDLQADTLTSSMIPYINYCKTTTLFEIAIEITSTLCKSSKLQLQEALLYVQNLGQAFQLLDDLIDMLGSNILSNKDFNMINAKVHIRGSTVLLLHWKISKIWWKKQCHCWQKIIFYIFLPKIYFNRQKKLS